MPTAGNRSRGPFGLAKEGDGAGDVRQAAVEGDDDGSPDAEVAEVACRLLVAVLEQPGAKGDVHEDDQDGAGLKSHLEFSRPDGAERLSGGFADSAQTG